MINILINLWFWTLNLPRPHPAQIPRSGVLGAKSLFILKVVQCLFSVLIWWVDTRVPVQNFLSCALQILNKPISGKLCVPKNVWVRLLFPPPPLLILKWCHYCRPFVTYFSKSQFPYFHGENLVMLACYLPSPAAMAFKCLVTLPESCTLCPQWYWICICTVSRDKKCWTDLATYLVDNL